MDTQGGLQIQLSASELMALGESSLSGEGEGSVHRAPTFLPQLTIGNISSLNHLTNDIT